MNKLDSTSFIEICTLQPGYYKLQVASNCPSPYLELIDRVDCGRGCLLAAGTTYLLHVNKPLEHGALGAASGIISSLEVNELVKISVLPRPLYVTVKLIALFRRHALQNFGPGEKLIIQDMDKIGLEKIAFDNAEFRSLRHYCLDDVSIASRDWPWIESGWPRVPVATLRKPRACDQQAAVCIYVHMHYWETWPEIENVLLSINIDFDLIITSTTERKADFERIRAAFPRCWIIVTENRGRDVGPFMQLLKIGAFDRYTAVCKIHGKLSIKGARETLSGVRNRRYALACLLAGIACERAYLAFDKDSSLGLLGPRNLLLPSPGQSAKKYIRTERKKMARIFQRAHTAFEVESVRFFAGTMFWFRPAALDRLRRAEIGIEDFEPECGAKRNTLQHAMERVFCLFAEEAGFRIAGLQPIGDENESDGLEYV